MTSIWLEFRLGFIPLDDLDDEEEEAVLHEMLWIDVGSWWRGGEEGAGGGCGDRDRS